VSGSARWRWASGGSWVRLGSDARRGAGEESPPYLHAHGVALALGLVVALSFNPPQPDPAKGERGGREGALRGRQAGGVSFS
jgi:hypothetical protein